MYEGSGLDCRTCCVNEGVGNLIRANFPRVIFRVQD